VVHQYKNNGFNIVLDVNSGCVHIVDDIVYELIPEVDKIRKENEIELELLKLNNLELTETELNNLKLKDIEPKDEELFKLALIEIEVNQMVEQILKNPKFTYSKEIIQEATEEIMELVSAEMLFTEDIYEAYMNDFKNRQTVV